MRREFECDGFEVRLPAPMQEMVLNRDSSLFWSKSMSGTLAAADFQMKHSAIGPQGMPVNLLMLNPGYEKDAVRLNVRPSSGNLIVGEFNLQDRVAYSQAVIKKHFEIEGFEVGPLEYGQGDDYTYTIRRRPVGGVTQTLSPVEVLISLANAGFIPCALAEGVLKNNGLAEHIAKLNKPAVSSVAAISYEALLEELAARRNLSSDALAMVLDMAPDILRAVQTVGKPGVGDILRQARPGFGALDRPGINPGAGGRIPGPLGGGWSTRGGR